MNLFLCSIILSSWMTFRGNNQRTGLVEGRSNFYQQAPAVLAAWVVHSSGNSVYGAPITYDQSGDGKEDIYITSHSSYPSITLYRGPSGGIIWNCQDYADAYYSTPALLPINYDPYPEVFQGFHNSGGLRCYDGGSGTRIWWAYLGGISYSSPLAFFDPSGNLRVAVVNDAGVLYYLDAGTGAVLWSYAGSASSYSAPALGDVNGDGTPEIAYTTANHIYVLDLSGNLLWDLAYGAKPSTPALSDMDGSPGLEMVIYDAGAGWVAVFAFGNPIPLWTYFVGAFSETFPPSPAVGDVNANGIPDVVIHNTRVVYCVENGTLVWSVNALGNDYLYGSPVLADLDGASVHDGGALETVITGEDENSYIGLVYYIQDDGLLCWRWSNPSYTDFPVYNEAALGDPNGDGWLEIVVVDYSCYAFILRGTDPLESGETVLETEPTRIIPTPRGLLVYAVSPCPVSVDFYDGSGRLVDSYKGSLRAGENLIKPKTEGILFYKAMMGEEEIRGKLVILE
ncbi:MAG: PQQ-binding-like beta-propeller repeat protein [candidate division WOR-3 bacterium]